MAIYYLIRGNTITAEIDTQDAGVVALPLMAGGQNISLINRAHILAIMNKFNRTAGQIVDDLGLVDEREATALESVERP